jgi:2-polyprenyl-3-methyl-5-hydroxy-6-metoxy-1,4-benzoquinol methylase
MQLATPIHTPTAALASTADPDYYGRERSSIISRIPTGSHVICDLGCGTGTVGRKLLKLGKAATVVGAELFEPAAIEAAKYYQHVHVGDVESIPMPYRNHFDYVLCGDVLEHLRDPYALVRKIRAWLKPEGRLICSVPNIRNWRILADLIFKGQWEYQDSGILDRTHLRFFTRRSAGKMLTDAGFVIESHALLIYGRKKNLINRVTGRLFAEFLATQTLFVGAIARSATNSGSENTGVSLP